MTDIEVRDTLYALAVGDCAGEAEMLWATLARVLPTGGGPNLCAAGVFGLREEVRSPDFR